MKSHYYSVMKSRFKQTLREELNYQNLTVKELSAKTGIPKPTIDCYLSARQVMPPADIAVRIAQALNVSVEYLVTGKDIKNNSEDFENFRPYRFLLGDLAKLEASQIEMFSVMIHAVSEHK